MTQDRIAELEREIRGLQDQLALLGGAIIGAAIPGGDPDTKLANLLEIADACKFLRSLDRYRQLRGMPEPKPSPSVQREASTAAADDSLLNVLTGAVLATALDDRAAVEEQAGRDLRGPVFVGGGGDSGGAGASASWEGDRERLESFVVFTDGSTATGAEADKALAGHTDKVVDMALADHPPAASHDSGSSSSSDSSSSSSSDSGSSSSSDSGGGSSSE